MVVDEFPLPGGSDIGVEELSPTRRDFIKTTAATAAAIVASPGVDLGSAQTIAAPGRRSAGTGTRKRGARRGALGGCVVCRCQGRTLPPPDDRHPGAPGQWRQRQRVLRHWCSNAGQRLLGICRDERDEPSGHQAGGARGGCAVEGCTSGAEASRRVGAGGARRRHVDHAGAAGSARGGHRRQDRAAACHERSGAEGQGRAIRQLRAVAAPRSEDVAHVGGHKRHADDDPRRPGI